MSSIHAIQASTDITRAPSGSRCLYCGRDVTGSYARKCIHLPAPEEGPNRIKFAGFGWSCASCQNPRGNPIEREDVVKEYLKEEKKMFQITVKLEAPEIASAICTLAEALSGQTKKVETVIKSSAITQTAAATPNADTTAKPEPETKDPAPTTSTTPTTEPSTPAVTLEQVRAKLATLSQSGKQAQVKKLITDFGAKKLTEVPAEKYAELLTAAEGL
jgi:hypothetical protein